MNKKPFLMVGIALVALAGFYFYTSYKNQNTVQAPEKENASATSTPVNAGTGKLLSTED